MRIIKHTFILTIFILLTVFLLTCNSSTTKITVAKSEVQSCANDSANKYVVYVPSHSEDCKAMPLIIILDPHGSGSFAMNHFLYAAEKYQCILAASNLVKNNFEGFVPTIKALISDIGNKYSIAQNIYIAGFSGGARMALIYAQNHKIEGVLACGALSSPDQLSAINAPIYALTGMADFNFPEIARYIFDEANKPLNLRLEIAGEMHEWPDSVNIYRAIGSLILSANQPATGCFQKKMVLKEFASTNNKLIDSLYKNNLLINARLVCENMLKIPNLTEKKKFSSFLANINKDPRLQSELTQLKRSLDFEFKVRDAYYTAFNSKDSEWWKNEIGSLNKKIASTTDIYMKYAYRRIKAFLGIVCYSVTNNSLRTDNLATAAKTLQIYKLIEPDNPDMLYFSSLYALKTGNKKVIKEYLQQAVKNGFEDMELIRKEFPEEYAREILERKNQ